MARVLAALMAGWMVASGSAGIVSAQGDAAGTCTVPPRTPREVAVVAGTPEPAPLPAQATPDVESATPSASQASREPTGPGVPDAIVLPEGAPAPDEVILAITGTMEQFTGCTNSRESLRMMALVTDEFLRGGFSGRALSEQDVMAFAGTPRPIDPADQRVLVTIRGTRILPDGRAGAVIDLASVGGPVPGEIRTDFVVFREVDGRWLIDSYAANLPPEQFGPDAG